MGEKGCVHFFEKKNRFSSPNIYIFLTILFLIVEKEDKITSVMEFAQ
jgi:hypothetical protein